MHLSPFQDQGLRNVAQVSNSFLWPPAFSDARTKLLIVALPKTFCPFISVASPFLQDLQKSYLLRSLKLLGVFCEREVRYVWQLGRNRLGKISVNIFIYTNPFPWWEQVLK